jgi:pimeloyl-ACP methyl ester carboxylesterase
MNDSKLSKLKFNLASFSIFLLFLLITLGAGFQALSEYLEQRSYSPSGALINMDGYRLHLYCSGSGNTTIFLESSLTFPAFQWKMVQQELSKFTQVCSYDRSGLGWSETSPVPRKGQEMIEEAYRLLRKGNIENPLIVVGYGNASLLARLFAHRYPDSVTALVLIDPTNDYTYQPSSLSMPITWLGITRLRGYLGGLGEILDPLSNTPTIFQREFLALTAYRTKYWSAAVDDFSSLDQLQLEVEANKYLGSLPVSVLANQITLEDMTARNGSIQQDRKDLIDELISSVSSQANLEVCTTCGIMPPVTNPSEVAEVILSVYNRVNP